MGNLNYNQIMWNDPLVNTKCPMHVAEIGSNNALVLYNKHTLHESVCLLYDA